jgi:diketogulonate reductase-like aldo/keto reductase
MATTTIPALKLNNGVEMPALGLGVFQSSPEETVSAVDAALRAGYRHIDTAAAYGNEREVGDAVRASGLDRSEVFLETKIWISDYGYGETLRGFGRIRAIGVSNFMVDHLERLLDRASVVRRSTRSSSTRTSARPTCRLSASDTGSSRRRGRRSAASRSTATAATPRRSRTR